MTNLKIIAKIADQIISLTLIFVGIYLFFFKQEFVNGAIVIMAHSIYQLPTVLLLNQLSPTNKRAIY